MSTYSGLAEREAQLAREHTAKLAALRAADKSERAMARQNQLAAIETSLGTWREWVPRVCAALDGIDPPRPIEPSRRNFAFTTQDPELRAAIAPIAQRLSAAHKAHQELYSRELATYEDTRKLSGKASILALQAVLHAIHSTNPQSSFEYQDQCGGGMGCTTGIASTHRFKIELREPLLNQLPPIVLPAGKTTPEWLNLTRNQTHLPSTIWVQLNEESWYNLAEVRNKDSAHCTWTRVYGGEGQLTLLHAPLEIQAHIAVWMRSDPRGPWSSLDRCGMCGHLGTSV